MNTEMRIRQILNHGCPDTGYSCPGCDECELLTYRIEPDEYVCGVCGLVSTVNETVAHYRKLKGEGNFNEFMRECDDIEAIVRSGAD